MMYFLECSYQVLSNRSFPFSDNWTFFLFCTPLHISPKKLQARFEPMTPCVRVEHVWLLGSTTKILVYQKQRDKSRGITKPRDRFERDLGNHMFHRFVRDGTRKSRDFLKFHGTSLHGIGISIFERDGIGIANNWTGPVWTGSGFLNYNGTAGLSRIPRNPRDFLNGKNPEESPGKF